ncbi:PH domain-containing protein [Actinotalea sp. C106]|uniref:PH domain-containing protein n=1 Tax=Actinotalea sp. C106 TaxID=2908644 RepID=UPI002028DA1E|nr:PH domain-containing protein [Actinotalea sp. C106]
MAVGRGFLWFVVLVNALLGLSLTGVALAMLLGPAAQRPWSTTTTVLVIAVGLVWAAGGLAYHRMFLHRPPQLGRSVTLTTVDGDPATVVPWQRERRVLALLISGVTAVGLIGLAIAWSASGNAGWWIPLVLGLLAGFAVPDGVIGVRWGARLVLTPEGVTVRGWDGEGHLAWADLAGVEVVPTTQEVVLRFTGRPDAPSWQARRRPRLLVARMPRRPYLDVPFRVIDVPADRLLDALLVWGRHPDLRAELATDAGRRRLVDPSVA